MSDLLKKEERRWSETISFRVSRPVKHLLHAAAARRDVVPSTYLRGLVTDALDEEFIETDQERPGTVRRSEPDSD